MRVCGCMCVCAFQIFFLPSPSPLSPPPALPPALPAAFLPLPFPHPLLCPIDDNHVRDMACGKLVIDHVV